MTPKIRDLGINVIPGTMRPPYMDMCTDATFTEPCEPGSTGQCVPSGKPQCPNTCPNNTKPPKQHAGGLTPDVVAQLRQQLNTQIGA